MEEERNSLGFLLSPTLTDIVAVDMDMDMDSLPEEVATHFLDYIYPAGDQKNLGVVSNTNIHKTVQEKLRLNVTEDDIFIQIENHLAKVIVSKMLQLSRKHKEEAEGKFPAGLDLDMSDKNGRKLISRILACANQISVKCRMGQASFIMIDPKYIQYFKTKPRRNMYNIKDTTTLFEGSLKIICYEGFGDTILVGRNGPKPEQALQLITTVDDISGRVGDVDGDVVDVDLAYILAEYPKSYQYYLQFDIKNHDND